MKEKEREEVRRCEKMVRILMQSIRFKKEPPLLLPPLPLPVPLSPSSPPRLPLPYLGKLRNVAQIPLGHKLGVLGLSFDDVNASAQVDPASAAA